MRTVPPLCCHRCCQLARCAQDGGIHPVQGQLDRTDLSFGPLCAGAGAGLFGDVDIRMQIIRIGVKHGEAPVSGRRLRVAPGSTVRTWLLWPCAVTV
jgi:hypothetical protein